MIPEVHEERMQEATWDGIRTMCVVRSQMEENIAAALQAKLTRLGRAQWLIECKAEMGWGRSAAYNHLRPENLQKDRDRDKAKRQRPETLDVPTSTPDVEEDDAETAVGVPIDFTPPPPCTMPTTRMEVKNVINSVRWVSDMFLGLGVEEIWKVVAEKKQESYEPAVLLPQVTLLIKNLTVLKKHLENKS